MSLSEVAPHVGGTLLKDTLPSPPFNPSPQLTSSSQRKGDRCSPSLVARGRIICARTDAQMMCERSRMSPTRNMRHSWPSRWQITALRENSSVCVRCLGRAILAKMIPTMNACKISHLVKSTVYFHKLVVL